MSLKQTFTSCFKIAKGVPLYENSSQKLNHFGTDELYYSFRESIEEVMNRSMMNFCVMKTKECCQ